MKLSVFRKRLNSSGYFMYDVLIGLLLLLIILRCFSLVLFQELKQFTYTEANFREAISLNTKRAEIESLSFDNIVSHQSSSGVYKINTVVQNTSPTSKNITLSLLNPQGNVVSSLEMTRKKLIIGEDISWTKLANRPSTSAGFRELSKTNNLLSLITDGYSCSPGYTGTLMFYNPNTNAWTTFPTNIVQYGLSVNSVGNNLFLFGGHQCSVGNVDYNKMYNTDTNTWQDKTSPIITSIWMGRTISVGEKIYYIGGTNDYNGHNGSILNINQVYNTTTNSWTRLANLPSPLSNHRLGQYNGKIYVVGGTTSWYNSLPTLYIYDIASNTWTQGASMNVARVDAGVVFHNGYLYAFGGSSTTGGGFEATDSASLVSIERYDIHANRWELLPYTIPVGGATNIVDINGTLYLLNKTNLYKSYFNPGYILEI